MPLLTISAVDLPTDRATQESLMRRLSTRLAQALDKPESWMMISLSRVDALMFAGSTTPACHASLSSVGNLDAARNQRLSSLLCEELQATLGVPQDRIYVGFHDVDGAYWGWNGETFA